MEIINRRCRRSGGEYNCDHNHHNNYIDRCGRRRIVVCISMLVAVPLVLLVVFQVLFSISLCEARQLPWIVHQNGQRQIHPLSGDHRSTNGFSRNIMNNSLKGNHRHHLLLLVPRGGSDSSDWDTHEASNAVEQKRKGNEDEERYSRQVYTLGARAHGLVRSSCVIVDGPLESGLLWESLKNLALSGIGKIVVLTTDDHQGNNDVVDKAYHDASLDDLGKMYIQGARAEIEANNGVTAPLDTLLVEFLVRLNPSLQVTLMSKSKFIETVTKRESNNNNVTIKSIILCIDRPYDRQVQWNDLCRQCIGIDEVDPSSSSLSSLHFVSVETAGVYGRIFCDFGPNHKVFDADGESPLVVPLDRVERLDSDTILIKTVDGERHDVSQGDVIIFQRSDGSTMDDCSCKVTKVLSPERIYVQMHHSSHSQIDDLLLQEVNSQAVSFSRQKQLQRVHFLSLKDSLKQKDVLFTPCDLDKSYDMIRRDAVFDCFQSLNTFARDHGRLPKSPQDHASFLELTTKSRINQHNEDWDRHCNNFLRTCRAKFVPLQAVFGAIVSQECLKAASGLYNPIQQFLLYDCDEVLDPKSSRSQPSEELGFSSGSSLSCIVGKEVERTLQNRKIFVVGSGAIGCEILKNLAAMGAGTGQSGLIIVTDMDTIEKSNLSRQLLFRDSDIGKFKSKAAQEAMERLNPLVKIECHTSKVGDEEQPGPFDSTFWSKGVDIILNALDNMEARLFMDAQCVTNDKALVDAGTLGSKGNVQVVVPHQSESYGSSVDPPEPAIPVCTLKNFPYAISHTIQWGRDLFDGLFVRRLRQANKYAPIVIERGVVSFANVLAQELGDQAALEAAVELCDDLSALVEDVGATEIERKEKAIQWAVSLAKQLFHDAIAGLLSEHPADSWDDDGEKFWSGSRKMPRMLSYASPDNTSDLQQEEINKNLADFVRSAARLRYESWMGIPKSSSENAYLVSEDEASNALTSAQGWLVTTGNATDKQRTDDSSNLDTLIRKQLAPLESLKNFNIPLLPTLSVAEFEKDDDYNDHIAFITAASNLRAICYGIPPVDSMETRKVAGRIVPAMITTTAFVSALSCIELVKLCTDSMSLQRHRNAFINLALPFFAFTAPLPAEEYPGLRGKTHTMWDRITIKEGAKSAKSGGLTLKRLLKRISKKAYKDDPDAISISNISVGPFMIYANFLHEDDDELLGKSIWKVVEEAMIAGNEFDQEFSRESIARPTISPLDDQSPPFIDLTVNVEDLETGDEVELPLVRVVREKMEKERE
jgi:ubiquitin-activating enzyme E1